MGMMLERRRTYLKKYRGHRTLNYLKIFIIKASISIRTKRTFDKWLISSSNLPILVFGYREFMFALVSLPVNITTPIIEPAAKTVFAHDVLSRLKDYFFPYEL